VELNFLEWNSAGLIFPVESYCPIYPAMPDWLALVIRYIGSPDS